MGSRPGPPDQRFRVRRPPFLRDREFPLEGAEGNLRASYGRVDPGKGQDPVGQGALRTGQAGHHPVHLRVRRGTHLPHRHRPLHPGGPGQLRELRLLLPAQEVRLQHPRAELRLPPEVRDDLGGLHRGRHQGLPGGLPGPEPGGRLEANPGGPQGIPEHRRAPRRFLDQADGSPGGRAEQPQPGAGRPARPEGPLLDRRRAPGGGQDRGAFPGEAPQPDGDPTPVRSPRSAGTRRSTTWPSRSSAPRSSCRMKNYTEKANVVFAKRMLGGFTQTVALNYLRAFLIDFFKKDVRELVDLLIIRGAVDHQHPLPAALRRLPRPPGALGRDHQVRRIPGGRRGPGQQAADGPGQERPGQGDS
ncbi:MAG: hypothetical protein MZV64_09340 [Ignavibacteriales bacterium]|nr:hypothetical protein [Ignavibacteriales bacterium]